MSSYLEEVDSDMIVCAVNPASQRDHMLLDKGEDSSHEFTENRFIARGKAESNTRLDFVGNNNLHVLEPLKIELNRKRTLNYQPTLRLVLKITCIPFVNSLFGPIHTSQGRTVSHSSLHGLRKQQIKTGLTKRTKTIFAMAENKMPNNDRNQALQPYVSYLSKFCTTCLDMQYLQLFGVVVSDPLFELAAVNAYFFVHIPNKKNSLVQRGYETIRQT